MTEIDVAAVAARAQAQALRRQAPRPEAPKPEAPAKREFRGNRWVNADGSAKPQPMPATAHPLGWTTLERVRFRPDSAVQVPGRSKGVYPHTELVVEHNPARGERSLILWLNKVDGEVVLEHPESGCLERVPLANVIQYRRAGDAPGDDSIKPVGMVRSLKL